MIAASINVTELYCWWSYHMGKCKQSLVITYKLPRTCYFIQFEPLFTIKLLYLLIAVTVVVVVVVVISQKKLRSLLILSFIPHTYRRILARGRKSYRRMHVVPIRSRTTEGHPLMFRHRHVDHTFAITQERT
ncbi:hypothetical protein K505DRAFT_151758 [Melanomma pulvis-pyrius CBS 109.77]|uniref:Uncharacterized protein n=1 Tax=Melanomma pulvis-pyrius CBS 109.77 TaxID=1314802 RepID=A0A6A6WPW9_9PLEO|nr:hypothetical protein K505DRAFT_151758 [Melanomma pulvis-pyrius CBS 109.77]